MSMSATVGTVKEQTSIDGIPTASLIRLVGFILACLVNGVSCGRSGWRVGIGIDGKQWPYFKVRNTGTDFSFRRMMNHLE